MLLVGKPSVLLGEFVHEYLHVEGRFSTETVVQPVPARTAPAIEFTFGDPYQVWSAGQSRQEAAHAVAVIGAQTYRRVHLFMRGYLETFVIVFRPGGLSRLFPVPDDALTNQHAEGHAVLGRTVEAFRARLGEARSFAERISLADRYLLVRPVSQRADRGIAAAARILQRRRGWCLRVSGMADLAGLSVRQFERRFISQIGVAPKLFARVARFEAAVESKKRSPGLRWMDIAHDLGYHDQMHMVHDFRQLSGSTPSGVLPPVDLFATGEAAEAR